MNPPACRLACLTVLAVMCHWSVARADLSTVYGIAPVRRPVVAIAPPPRAVVTAPARRPTTVVKLPSGYIAVLPSGYRVVTAGGRRYYYVGAIHYRAQFYQGRTVYVRVDS